MSQTFVSFRNKGVWINDNTLEIPMSYIAEVIAGLKKKPVWLKELNVWIILKSQKEYNGIDLGWDEYLSTSKRINFFLNILEKSKEVVKDKGDFISLEEINRFRIKGGRSQLTQGCQKSSEVINVIDLLIKLFSQKIEQEENEYENMY